MLGFDFFREFLSSEEFSSGFRRRWKTTHLEGIGGSGGPPLLLPLPGGAGTKGLAGADGTGGAGFLIAVGG